MAAARYGHADLLMGRKMNFFTGTVPGMGFTPTAEAK